MKKNTKTMRLPKSTAQETTTTESPRQTVGIDLGDQTSLGAFSTLKATFSAFAALTAVSDISGISSSSIHPGCSSGVLSANPSGAAQAFCIKIQLSLLNTEMVGVAWNDCLSSP